MNLQKRRPFHDLRPSKTREECSDRKGGGGLSKIGLMTVEKGGGGTERRKARDNKRQEKTNEKKKLGMRCDWPWMKFAAEVEIKETLLSAHQP